MTDLSELNTRVFELARDGERESALFLARELRIAEDKANRERSPAGWMWPAENVTRVVTRRIRQYVSSSDELSPSAIY